MVITDKIDDVISPRRTCIHLKRETKKQGQCSSSLARHDRGLTTVIGRSDKDASGQKIDNSIRSTFERLRRWDSRIPVNSSTDRNLSKAFSQLHLLKDKLGLSDAIVEKTAYII